MVANVSEGLIGVRLGLDRLGTLAGSCVIFNRVENGYHQPIGMVGELWTGASRPSASLNADDRAQLRNQWRLAWVVVFAVALTACSGTPSSRSSTSSCRTSTRVSVLGVVQSRTGPTIFTRTD